MGRGHKTCIKCGEVSGVRLERCKCGHVFIKGENSSSSSAAALKPKEEGAGRGKMKCSCGEYIGVRSAVCNHCGKIYDASRAEKKPVEVKQTKQEAGRGRKQCPGCKTFVGVKTIECPHCHHRWVMKSSSSSMKSSSSARPAAPVPPPLPRRVSSSSSAMVEEVLDETTCRIIPHKKGNRRVAIPAGKCPAKLLGTDAEAVETWTEAVLMRGDAVGITYEVSALKYWVREFFPLLLEEKWEYNPTHREVCRIIDELYTAV